MAKKKIRTCALCGELRVTTREHVPPKNLFLAPRPKNTITAPVCNECNYRYHLDDEYFRVYVCAGAKPETRLARLWDEKVVGSSFSRGEGLRSRLNNDRARLQEHHMQEPLRTFEDEVLANELAPLAQLFSASRINAVVEKIVRCLYFLHYNATIAAETHIVVDTTPLTNADERLLYEHRTGCVGHYDEFVYHHETTSEGTPRWLLGFYHHHTFTVKTQKTRTAD